MTRTFQLWLTATLLLLAGIASQQLSGSHHQQQQPAFRVHTDPPVPTPPPPPSSSASSSSLLSVIGLKPGLLSPPSTPVHLSDDTAPQGTVVHSSYSRQTCSETELTATAGDATVVECVARCVAAGPSSCRYVTVSDEGTCQAFSGCPEAAEANTRQTVYAVAHRNAPVFPRTRAGPRHDPLVSHLWRLNKSATDVARYAGASLPVPDLPGCISEIFSAAPPRPSVDTSVPELGVDHVYMVHYTRLATRRVVITRLHRMQGIESDWITAFDHQNITEGMRGCLHERWDPAVFSNPRKRARKVPSPFVSQGGFRPGELSVNTKHHYIYHDIVRNNFTFSVVLEDDAKLRVGFRRHFAEALKAVPGDFDIVVFGGCLKMFGWRAKQRAVQVSKHIYRKDMIRCAHAYALTLAAAKKLLSSMPMTDVIDYQINRAIEETGLKVYWVEPWLSVQGPVGEAGQPRKTATTGGDGEPYNIDNLKVQTWLDTWHKGVPFQPFDTFKIPKTSSSPVCSKKTKECWWL